MSFNTCFLSDTPGIVNWSNGQYMQDDMHDKYSENILAFYKYAVTVSHTFWTYLKL